MEYLPPLSLQDAAKRRLVKLKLKAVDAIVILA